MKLERLFEVKDSKLVKVGTGEEARAEPKTVRWSDVEGAEGEYSEEFLAKLRDELKTMENSGKFVFIEPVSDRDAPFGQFVAAMKHCARRIKDCKSVAGFAIPEIADSEEKCSFFVEEISAKHAHYCFFSKNRVSAEIALY